MYDIFKTNSDTYMERNGGDEFLLFLGGTSIRELEKRLMDFSQTSHVLTLEGKKTTAIPFPSAIRWGRM